MYTTILVATACQLPSNGAKILVFQTSQIGVHVHHVTRDPYYVTKCTHKMHWLSLTIFNTVIMLIVKDAILYKTEKLQTVYPMLYKPTLKNSKNQML